MERDGAARRYYDRLSNNIVCFYKTFLHGMFLYFVRISPNQLFWNNFHWSRNLGKPQKTFFFFFSGQSTKKGGGKGFSTKKKRFFNVSFVH